MNAKKLHYLNLDFSKIQAACPKAVKEVIEWFCNKKDLIEGLIGMDGGNAKKEEIQEAMKHVVPMIIQYDPRKLYDFFDDWEIIISISQHEGDMFTVHNSRTKHSVAAENRAEAELIGFTEAFKELEKQLSDEKASNTAQQGKAGVESPTL